MTQDLSPDNARYLDDAVREGIYQDVGQALDQAVDLLRQRDQLRADVQAGIAQADDGQLLDADEVFDRLEAKATNIESCARTDE